MHIFLVQTLKDINQITGKEKQTYRDNKLK